MTLAAPHISETITLGSLILGALVAMATLIVIAYGSKWKVAAQVEAANAQAWEDAARRLETEVEKLRLEVDSLRRRVSELERLPDVAAVHAALMDHDQASARAMDSHDQNAERRAQRLIDAIHDLGKEQVP